ncbi:MAG: DUF378 domain-containing protein [bacterium]|jgi:uncharacterized membrane protein YuzA (DUF378 family)|nr:DUF378 domain-containing protein [bacterium]MDD4153609.1 DUF378 domain-containing protein [bacterium]MDD4558910.1 DUF378 domain-containing protein [bacterium]
MRGLGTLDWTALVLLIIGGLNWGLIGAFGFNLVAAIFGDMTVISRIIYVLVGLSAIYIAVISPMLREETRMART